MPANLADIYLDIFKQLPFSQGQVKGGQEHRLTCFFSEIRNNDGTLRDYFYAGKTNAPYEFTPAMQILRDDISIFTVGEYNSCLVNLYRNGRDVIGYHSDSEKSLIAGSTIASISLGAERWFDVKAKNNAPDPDREYSICVKHGSLLIMGGQMQSYYKYQIRQEAACKHPRINLTFRLSK